MKSLLLLALISFASVGYCLSTADAQRIAQEAANVLQLNSQGFSDGSVVVNPSSRLPNRLLYRVTSAIADEGTITIDSAGEVVVISNWKVQKAIQAGAPGGEPMALSSLESRAQEILNIICPRCRGFRIVESRIQENSGSLSYVFRSESQIGGFKGGDGVTISLDPYSGQICRFGAVSPYPYQSTQILITKSEAVQIARDYWNERAPSSVGEWPGDEVALQGTKDPRWQWPWPLWGSPSTQAVLARGEYPLAYVVDVNKIQIHVNAVTGEVQGGFDYRQTVAGNQRSAVAEPDLPPKFTSPHRGKAPRQDSPVYPIWIWLIPPAIAGIAAFYYLNKKG